MTRTFRRLLGLGLVFAVSGLITLTGHAAQLPVLSTDNVWETLTGGAARATEALRTGPAVPATLVRLNKVALDSILARAPMQDSAASLSQSVVMSLPLPNGRFQRFRIEEAPTLAPELASAFPEIKTYKGIGLDDTTATARFGWTSAGFTAIIINATDTVYVDPAVAGETLDYAVVRKADLRPAAGSICQLDGRQANALPNRADIVVSNGTVRHNYRLALAATTEYTATALATSTAPAGSKAAALAQMVTTVVRVNGIYDRELSVTFTLSTGTGADPTALIQTGDTLFDGYTNNDGGAMLAENQGILDAVVGSANYDIGHVFSTGGGGVASLGSVCVTGSKARGVTGNPTPRGDSFDVDFVAHEIGHQFGGQHTFNGTTGNCGGSNRAASSAFEPGSGSTIMAYANICGNEDIQTKSDDYFHVQSLNQISTFLAGTGSTCGGPSSSVNRPPTVSAGPSRTIPSRTPFTLTAIGADPDGDALTYSWEEYDLGGASTPATLNLDDGARPLFRSYSPITNPSRTFPSLPFILKHMNVPPVTYSGASEVAGVACVGGTCATAEVLPSRSRTMTFQATSRDGRGGFASASTAISVISFAGPFQVTQPNGGGIWGRNTTQTVRWDVAGTTGFGINTATVKISLSTDGGLTFPTVLLASTPNTGFADVLVPNIFATKARIKVEAVDNIFFDISDTDFEIGDAKVDLAFVVDDTGSMSEEIGGVRAGLANMITELERASTTFKIPFPTVAIVTFKDDVTTRLISNVPSALQAVVASLFASGGADCAEASNAALIVAGQLLANEGKAVLFTDADSRPDGPDRASVLNVFRPKNIELSVLLSGTCSGAFRSTRGDSASPFGYSDNRDPAAPEGANVRTSALASAVLGFESAIRTFSELSSETGGLFTSIPEVNFSAAGATKYRNVTTNLALSSVLPAVALVAPSDAPQGATLILEVTGSNTNFQGSSVVSISGTGVSLVSKTAISPTRIQVTLAIAAGAPTGFRDVTVTTNLGAGITEIARGIGSLQVVSPPITAQVLGITPASVGQGKTLDVLISGINTAFSNASVVSLGTGITINGVTALSATLLRASIAVSSTAPIGYRDVRVTTGAQIATESVVGPLLVTAPPPVLPRITSTAPAGAKRGRRSAVTVLGENTNFAAGVTALSFGGTGITVNSVTVNSKTSLLAILTIAPNASLGFRNVTVTTGAESAVLLNGFNVTDPAAFPGTLVFGATKNGAGGSLVAVTPPQEVTVSYTGISTTAAWTATVNRPWLRLLESSGSGAGRFRVTVADPSNTIGAQTDLNGTVTITIPSAGITETVDVRLLVHQSPRLSVAPFGQVDTPSQNASGIVGALAVTGWAADDVGVREVQIFRQCAAFEERLSPSPCGLVSGHRVVFLGNATFVVGARPDVELGLPGVPATNRAGWGFMVLTNMLPHIPKGAAAGGQGSFTFYAFAIDEDGHTTLLGRSPSDHTPTTVAINNDAIAKPFGTIDTPGQGATASSTAYANFGWVLTPDPGTGVLMPTDGSTIRVFIDGSPVGTVTYNQCRGTVGSPVPPGLGCDDDVSKLFRGAGTRFRNLDPGRGPIGVRLLDTTTLGNGLHTISWGVIDSAGRAEGIGSRFFTVLNSTTSILTAPDGPPELNGAPLDETKPLAPAHLSVRTGFGATAFMPLETDAAGVGHAAIPELGRLDLQIPGAIRGVLIANGETRALPSGLRLDAASGRVTWAPGPGYLGTYRLAFERPDDRVMVDITVGSGIEGPAMRMNIDTPAAGSRLPDAWVTVAGWALDSRAADGSGVGTVHVWAFRDGVANDPNPLFLGTATLGLPRPDVAAAHGKTFTNAGFSLTAQLAPGTYEIVAYAWSVRTGRFEDARKVRITVR